MMNNMLRWVSQQRRTFLKFLLLAMLVGLTAVTAMPAVETVFQSYATVVSDKGRKLPIYSVDTDKKYVALSFDAAWGGGWYGLEIFALKRA